MSSLYIPRLEVDTGDERTSYLTRLGINQIRGVMFQIHRIIHRYMEKLPPDTRYFPINVVSDESIAAAESCFHVRSLLLSVEYNVSEQITDLGLQYNYFHKRSTIDFVDYQRVQIHYMLQQFLTPDQSDASRPSLHVHILCGDGRLFTAFRQELVINKMITGPVKRYASFADAGHNALRHGNAFYLEAVGSDALILHEPLTLATARDIPEEQRVPTDHPLELPPAIFQEWLHSESGPCSLTYFIENKEKLARALTTSASAYSGPLAYVLKKEWDPYLAGLFIYACRVQLTVLESANSHAALATVDQPQATNQCGEQATASAAAGPSGDCA